VQKARKTGRLVLFGDGSINAAASDARRGVMTDPDQQMRSRGGLGASEGEAVQWTFHRPNADIARAVPLGWRGM
jgi:hypothetical protein